MASSLGEDVLVTGEAGLKALETEAKKERSSAFEMRTSFSNGTSRTLYTGEQKLWDGTTGSVAIQLAPGRSSNTRSTGTKGVKFGRVYTDSEEELPTTRKYVVAFDSPTGKVYAESGPIGPVDWNVVEDRLGKSEATIVYEDNILGGKIEAGVYENGNGYARFTA